MKSINKSILEIMKAKCLALMVLLSLTEISLAQDVIVMKDGSTIISKVLEVNTSDIKYKKFSNQKGPTYTINKSEVTSINYKNGERDVFEKSTNEPKSQPQSTLGNMSAESKKNNDAIIARMNSIMPQWTEPQKTKKATGVYCLFKIKEESVFENDDIKQTVSICRIDPQKANGGAIDANPKHEKNGYNHVLAVKVYNKTAKTLYIDLGNTFIVRGEEASAYYTPSSTTVTQSESSGVGVNLGAVADVMDMGGSFKKIADGINVGKEKGNAISTVEYAQRVVAIPPKSAKTLEHKFLFTRGLKGLKYLEIDDRSDKTSWFVFAHANYNNLNVGDIVHWTEADSPMTFDFHIAYSENENCTELNRLKVGMYMSETYGTTVYFKLDNLKNWHDTPCHLLLINLSDNKKGLDVSQFNVEHTGK